MATRDILLHGIHTVLSKLKCAPHHVKKLFLLKERQDQRIQLIVQQATQHNIAIEWVSRQTLDKLSNAVHQGVIALCTAQPDYQEKDLPTLLETAEAPFFLILDNIQDPHNLGACIRTANAASITAVILPKDRTAPLSATVNKVASGGLDNTPVIRVTNLVRTMTWLKENHVWLYGFAGEATQSLHQTTFNQPAGLVFGGEGNGLRTLTQKTCDVLVHIPMHGQVESLNVSVACAIGLYECLRQRALN